MKRSVAVVSALCIASAAAAGGLVEVGPHGRCDPRMITLEYERPFGGLPLQSGRVEAGLPLISRFWLGASATGMQAPTVTETGFGAWVGVAEWMKAGAVRREVRVAGLDALVVHDLRVDLQVVHGPFALGWSGESTGLGDAAAPEATRRTWWIGISGSSNGLSIGRRSHAWSDDPDWEVGLEMRLGGRVALAATWRHVESLLAFRFAAVGSELTAATAWSGPRAGGLGLRLRSWR